MCVCVAFNDVLSNYYPHKDELSSSLLACTVPSCASDNSTKLSNRKHQITPHILLTVGQYVMFS